LNIVKGDCFYLFSDGFADQFGGDSIEKRKAGGKKLKSAVFKRHLMELYSLSMEEQKERLSTIFTSWRGELEQNDDVVVVGIKV
jgi:serine phosphatase RsbU (regulator of sigma subunit)